MKKILTGVIAGIALSTAASSVSAQTLPPADAKAGECYAKVLIPAVYNTTPENVLVQPETVSTKKFQRFTKTLKSVFL